MAATIRPSRCAVRRPALLAGTSVAAILLSSVPALAQQGPGVNFFGGAAGVSAAQTARAASAQANRQAGNAAAVAQRTREALNRSTQVRQAMANAQTAARAAAIAGAAGRDIPNGLGEGGLQVADGVVFDPTGLTPDDPRLGQANLWVGANGPTQTNEGGRTVVEIDQTQQKAILTWETFNVGRDTTVRFDQSAGGANASEWIALNRIEDPNSDPSRIYGNIEAQGQVYLINRNGILFGGTSQVNVHGLIASSLDIAGDTLAERNKRFVDGILTNPRSQTLAAVLAFGERFEGRYPVPTPFNPDPEIPDDSGTLPGEVLEGRAVIVEEGARIETGVNGRAMLLGHNVINRGVIESEEGQVILAAGRGIYLAQNADPDAQQGTSTDQTKADPDLRGLVVSTNRGGGIENHGVVSSDRGNVTLTGKSVLQAGIARATTSATRNGTLVLRAGDFTGNGVYPQPALTGTLTLGEGSLTEIAPDGNGETAAGFGQFRPSEIAMGGRRVVLERNATVYAPNANIEITAGNSIAEPLRDPETGEPVIDPDSSFSYLQAPDDGRIYLETGSIIDVGGLRDVDVAASANSIEGELRANELADNPVLRDSVLRGRTVYFDARRGTEIANLTGYYDLIERGVGEQMVEGGNLSLTGAEVIAREGSTIDLSGGSLNYQGGFVRSTLLIDRQGNVVAIEDARRGVEYVGVFGDTVVEHERWGVTEVYSSPFYNPQGRYVAGYIEGRSAGSLNLGTANLGNAGRALVLDGDIAADIVIGENQRDPSTGATSADVAQVWRERPSGASLTVGSAINRNGRDVYLGGNVTIGDRAALDGGFTSGDALDSELSYNYRLSDDYFDGQTFSNVTLYSGLTAQDAGAVGGRLDIEDGTTLDMGDFGSFRFFGTQAQIDGTIRAADGTIAIRTDSLGREAIFDNPPVWEDLADEDRPSLRLGANGVLDVSGRWINDFTSPDRPALAIDGGSVSLVTAGDLELAEGSLIDVSGGGHLAADGRTVTPGDGGAITLVNNVTVGGVLITPITPNDGAFTIDGELRGFALGDGATLTIATGQAVAIGDTPVLEDGVLEAGEEAEVDFALAADLILPAGSVVPFDVNFTVTVDRIAGGEAVPDGGVDLFEVSPPVVLGADWVVPDEIYFGYVVTNDGFFGVGDVIPAGSTLTEIGGGINGGYVIPADVFPDGLPIPPVTTSVPVAAGEVAPGDITVAAGSIIRAGSVLDQDVQAQALLNLTPDLFTSGGFANFSIAGANGLAVTEGTTIAPTVDSYLLDRAGRDIRTGESLYEVARRGALPETQTQATSVALSARWFDLAADNPQNDFLRDTPGRVVVGQDAEIRQAPDSVVRLISVGRGNSFSDNFVRGEVRVDGVISTPGGDIRIGAEDIRLGAGAQLLAPGYLDTRFDGQQTVRSVEAGGSIVFGGATIQGNNEAFGGSRLFTHADSVIDVSGVRGEADLERGPSTDFIGGRYVTRTIDGAGGSVSLGVQEGVLAGRLDLAAGGETGRAGSLRIGNTGGFQGPQGVFGMAQSLTDTVAEAAETASEDTEGVTLVADRINESGVRDLLISGGVLRLDGDVLLETGRSMEINLGRIVGGAETPGDVTLRSRHVSFRPVAFAPSAAPADGTTQGAFRVEADLIDIGVANFGCGEFDCGGVEGGRAFETVDFVSGGDIRFLGSGGVATAGDLTFTATQVYTGIDNLGGFASNTGGQFSQPTLVQSNTAVNFLSNGETPRAPVAFGGALTVRAPEIVQAGVLRSPYGEIRLEATESVTLAPGSLTTVSLDGVIVPVRPDVTAGLPTNPFETANPQPNSIRAEAPDVTIADGAVIDVSGGGDLVSYGFTRGNGGTVNVLQPGLGYFAVAPSVGDGPAPVFDRAFNSNVRFQPVGDYKVGDQIYLEGIEGLADGVYTLLPSDYALTPDAVLIRPTGAGDLGYRPQTTVRDDGTIIAAGYLVNADGQALGNRGYSRFEVMTQKVFNTYSELTPLTYSGVVDEINRTAADRAAGTNLAPVVRRSNRDAGSVVLAATDSLVLDGEGRFDAAEGGLLGNLDIASARIAVTTDGAEAPEGFLVLDADRLTGFGSGSLLIGGSRSFTANGTEVTVAATDVIIANDEDSALTGPEVIVAATDTVTLADGAVIEAEGTTVTDANPLRLQGDGALVRVSTGDRVLIDRQNAFGGAGTLDLGAGARLAAAGSLSLDASGDILIDPDTVLEATQLDLSSTTVSLGDAPDDVTGTILSNATLAKLSGAEDLLIRGSNAIDIYGGTVLGGRNAAGEATLGSVTFDTARLQGRTAAGETATVTAGEIVLRNSGEAASDAPVAGEGVLNLAADTLILGPGEVDLVGFGSVSAGADGLVARGEGGLDIAGDATVRTALVTAEAGSEYGLRATGDLALLQGDGEAEEVEDFGGRLAVSGANVRIDTVVGMPAGVFEAAATGDLTLGQAAAIDVSGVTVDFRDVVRHAGGGTVRLNAGGNLTQAAGALIDVSGDERGGHAGRVEIAAEGTASLDGAFDGTSADGFRGGGLVLDAGSLADFAGLNAALEAGAMSQTRAIRVAAGDLTLAAGQTMTAHDVLLRTDGGRVTVAGTIDVDGIDADADGGTIRLIGGNGVELAATGRLDARAAATEAGDFEADSGFVEIAATGGRVNLASGSVIDVSGGRQGGGQLLVRADRDGADIAIDRMDAQVVGARERAVAGVASYQTETVDEAARDTALDEADAWMANSAAISARLGGGYEVRPGVEFVSDGDLTVTADIDLGARYGGNQAGYLDLVAQSDLIVDAAISDGFASAERDAALNTGRSWSYGFKGGDDMTLAAGRMVRTGTGDIRIETGRDLVFADNQSVLYTAGTRTETEAGFVPVADFPTGEFPTQGGEIAIAAGRDILAPITQQAASDWLFRYGRSDWGGSSDTSTVAEQTSWSIVFKNFEQGIGALGGGNIDIAAGRDASQISVALPTTGHMTTQLGDQAQVEDVVIRGGGDLTLTTGNDLLGGIYFLGRGQAEVASGGEIRESDTEVTYYDQFGNMLTTKVGPLFALMDAAASVTARQDLTIDAAFDPMAFQTLTVENTGPVLGRLDIGSYFNSHTERTALEMTSTSGDVLDRGNADTSVLVTATAPFEQRVSAAPVASASEPQRTMAQFSRRAPGTVKLASLQGDVTIGSITANPYVLSPTDNGQLELLAAGDLIGAGAGGLRPVYMLDRDTPYRRGPTDPYEGQGATVRFRDINASTNYERGARLTHEDDPEPVRLYALGGNNSVAVDMPKPVLAYAGLDFTGRVIAQNNRPEHISSITAGRDIRVPTVSFNDSNLGLYTAANYEGLNVSGPGMAVLEAGRHVDAGVISSGSRPGRGLEIQNVDFATGLPNGIINPPEQPLVNSALPEQGADVFILAGTAKPIDYAAFASAYLDPANGEGVVRTYLPELMDYMKGLGFSGLSEAELTAKFGELPIERQKPFLQQVFFTELKETGLDVTDPDSPRFQDYDRGYAAIKLLFPLDTEELEAGERADVKLNARQVETQAGGNITILAPYGKVDVGSPIPVRGALPEQGGVITRRGGDIRIMADDDISLYLSRVFTLLGGDITMWTSNGDITAGAGAKTTGLRPPLIYEVDNDGNVSLNVFGLQTGAGIGVLDVGGTGAEERKRSRLDLIAPRGEVNAGDAGIRVIGDLNIAALRVVGLDNIQVSGEATGLPELVAVNVGALTAASSAASSVSEAAEELVERNQRPVVRDMPSIITVEVLGFGD